jgi:hypothetical protein
MAVGNRIEDLEFFYTEPFQWSTRVLDYVLESGGKVYGLRARIRRYKPGPNDNTMRSFLLKIRDGHAASRISSQLHLCLRPQNLGLQERQAGRRQDSSALQQ